MIYTLPSGLKVEFWFKHWNPASTKPESRFPLQPTENKKHKSLELLKQLEEQSTQEMIDTLRSKGFEVTKPVTERPEPHLDENLAHTEVHLTFKNRRRLSSHSAYATCAKMDTFNKETGRKTALRRLLDELPFSLSYEDRKYLWSIALPKKVCY